MTTAFGTGVTGPDGRSLDQVQLTGVSARGYHGVLPSERQTGQEFRADVVLYLDTRPAAAGDDLAQTVSYADVASDVHDILTGEPADLVETVAERIAAAVLARPQVEAVDVRVHKPQAPIPVPFADVEVTIRRDRVHAPVVAAPATLARSAEAVGPAAGADALQKAHDALRQSQEPSELAYEPNQQDTFRTEPPVDSWNEAAERSRSGSDAASFAAEPVQQDFEPIGRPATDEPEPFQPEPYRPPEPYQPEPYQPEPAEPVQQRTESSFEAEPLVERVPASVPSAAQPPVEMPEPRPVPELIAPEPLQVVPAAWDLQPDAPAPAEQRDQRAQEPVFQPEEQFQAEPVFEPVQQYESVQGLDQRQAPDRSNGFEQQYDPFAQPEQAQPEQQGQRFEQQGYEQPQQYDQRQQQGYDQPQPVDPQQNQYDQLFEQQYDRGEMETTRVSGAVPDSAVGQPEQYAQEQYQPEGYQQEPRDRFDEVPAGYVEVVIAIGANLGDPQATMRSAVAELDRLPGLQITDVSPLARTAAVGGPEEQPDYLNAVLLARTTLSARALLHACQEVENVHGRTREEHWGPRTLDVDLITYGNLTDSADDLEVPHPRAHERAFVLEPWSQIAPDAVLPGLGGGPVAQLAATAPDRAGIRWLALDWLTDPEPEQGGGGAGATHPTAPDDGGQPPAQDAHVAEMPPTLPPSLPPSGRPQASPGGPVVEVPGGGHPQGQHSGQVDLDRQVPGGAPQQEGYPGGPHPQAHSSGPVPGSGGSVPIPQQVSQAAPATPRAAPPAGMPGSGSAVPPPEEALVPAPPAPIAPRAVRDTAHEEPEHEPLPQQTPAKPVFAPVNPSRQQSGVFPPVNGGGAQEPAAPVFAPVNTPPNGMADFGQNGLPNGQVNGHANGQPDGYDSDHTVIRVPGFVGDRQAAPSDGPIDSVPSWVPVRDERGRDA
ncbi:2-amino-4-hydroxy-6-hydroxymethyldihydropteridine diphosphokinase [Promicromonospora panici]|uniref:2-amino-4-hydroxy-6- hydroxymethyldihydropteridine diphosphokinase n=1 Tax=Promicromonospora panici TaxID=2219658 RepID=UPI001F5D08F6|nr:2-amino-4-hydroxy-6-hydroxymethyldihydropteridine diphosphokinase [Promicromonospora panici]